MWPERNRRAGTRDAQIRDLVPSQAPCFGRETLVSQVSRRREADGLSEIGSHGDEEGGRCHTDRAVLRRGRGAGGGGEEPDQIKCLGLNSSSTPEFHPRRIQWGGKTRPKNPTLIPTIVPQHVACRRSSFVPDINTPTLSWPNATTCDKAICTAIPRIGLTTSRSSVRVR